LPQEESEQIVEAAQKRGGVVDIKFYEEERPQFLQVGELD